MFRGTFIAQVIAIVGAVFLAKLYGEEAYGVFGIFMSILGIVAIISTLQLDKCIILSKDEKERLNWFNFLLLVIPLIIGLLSLILFFPSNFTFHKEHHTFIVFLAIVGSLVFSFNLIHESFFTSKKQFTILSNSKIVVTISNVVLQILLYRYYNLLGLIIGFLISQCFIFFYFFYKSKKVIKKPDFTSIKSGIKTNISIVKFLFPSSLINALANNLMPILIGVVFGVKEAGVYFFSSKILGTPLHLISSSISQVFFQKSSELYRNNKSELLRITKKIVSTNLILMLLFLIGMNTIGIYILEVYFNSEWSNLRIYTLILSVLIFARTSFNPISSLIVVLDKNLVSLIFNTYLFIVNLIGIYIGYLNNSIVDTILILTIFGSLGYVFLLFYFLRHLKNISKK